MRHGMKVVIEGLMSPAETMNFSEAVLVGKLLVLNGGSAEGHSTSAVNLPAETAADDRAWSAGASWCAVPQPASIRPPRTRTGRR